MREQDLGQESESGVVRVHWDSASGLRWRRFRIATQPVLHFQANGYAQREFRNTRAVPGFVPRENGRRQAPKRAEGKAAPLNSVREAVVLGLSA